jgi:hypothetical protein
MTGTSTQYRRPRVCGPINGVALWIPKDVSGLVLWLCAADIPGVDGDAITSWVDRSTAGNNMSQTTVAAKPTLKLNIANGQPVARFDGGDSMVPTAEITGSPVHIFAVLRPSNVANYYTIMGRTTTGALQLRQTNTGIMQMNKSGVALIGTASTPMSAVQFNNINASYSNPNYAFRLNGADDGSGASAQTVTAINRLGSNYTASPELYLGDMAEVLVFNSVLSAGDRGSIENYLKAKYGL